MLPDPRAVAEALAMYELSRMEGPAHNRTKFWQHLTDETAQPMVDAARAYADSEEVCEYRLRPWRICGVSRTAHSPDVEGHQFVPGLLVFTDRPPARLILEDTNE